MTLATRAEDRYPGSPTLKQSPHFSRIFCLIADMIASRTRSYILNNYPMVIRKKKMQVCFLGERKVTQREEKGKAHLNRNIKFLRGIREVYYAEFQ